MVSIDSVYQQVLAVMSKERRGELTPPHFNILANKAQNDIFEKTLYDYETALRDDSDSLAMLKEKIAVFRKTNQTLTWNGTDGTEGSLQNDTHLLESVYINENPSVRSINMKLPRGADLSDGDSTNNPYLDLRAYYDGTGSVSAGEDKYRIWFNEKDNISIVASVGESHRVFTVDGSFTQALVGTNFVNWINDNSPYHRAEVVDADEGLIRIIYLQDASLINTAETSNGIGFTLYTPVEKPAILENIHYHEVDHEDWLNMTSPTSGKLKPMSIRPVYYRKSNTVLGFYPPLDKDIKHDYISKPTPPKWSGVSDGIYFKKQTVTDFTLHPSEESSLVNKILELVGITLDDLELSSVVIQNEATVENDKNN